LGTLRPGSGRWLLRLVSSLLPKNRLYCAAENVDNDFEVRLEAKQYKWSLFQLNLPINGNDVEREQHEGRYYGRTGGSQMRVQDTISDVTNVT
jgi:hypothetical protein